MSLLESTSARLIFAAPLVTLRRVQPSAILGDIRFCAEKSSGEKQPERRAASPISVSLRFAEILRDQGTSRPIYLCCSIRGGSKPVFWEHCLQLRTDTRRCS